MKGLGPLGASPRADGTTDFRVWAPAPARVDVQVGGGGHRLHGEGRGLWHCRAPALAGDDYVYLLDGRPWPDPCSRAQPAGVHGASRIVDPGSFEWSDDAWEGLRLEELVLYELHVGAFTAAGTFAAVAGKLGELRELGVTAIELMPIATFPGTRGWGYDGVYTYAPHHAYGGPDGLAALVDAAHAAGLGVVLDVVYNHIGPGSEAISAFGPYFSDRHETFWGKALNYDGPGAEGVRAWAVENACMWVRDYHVDGLRLDAVHAIVDESPLHVLAELAARVRAERPGALVISEMGQDDLHPLHDWGHDAMWLDSLHHALHVALTGERDGYYAAFDGSMQRIAEELTRPEGRSLVVAAQNHDQVGNRALGDRLPPEALRVAAACVLFAPLTPLLFMGQECGEPNPFQFFTDHGDPAIAEATRTGRRREFDRFAAFGGHVPDPQAPETFARSRLSRVEQGGLRELHARLLALRPDLPDELEVAYSEDERRLTLRRGRAELLLDFERHAVELSA